MGCYKRCRLRMLPDNPCYPCAFVYALILVFSCYTSKYTAIVRRIASCIHLLNAFRVGNHEANVIYNPLIALKYTAILHVQVALTISLVAGVRNIDNIIQSHLQYHLLWFAFTKPILIISHLTVNPTYSITYYMLNSKEIKMDIVLFRISFVTLSQYNLL